MTSEDDALIDAIAASLAAADRKVTRYPIANTGKGKKNDLLAACTASSKVREFLEIEPMKEAIEAAIKALTEKSGGEEKSEDAMKFAQAALNLAHVAATFKFEFK